MPDADRGAGGAYWRRLVFVFFLGWVLIYANRTVLSPLLSVLQIEWSMTRAQLGLLNSAFFLMYTLMQVPTGLLADRWGRRRLLLPGYLVQGFGALASGLARGVSSFLAARVVTGLGQSTYYSTQYALASTAIPARNRAQGMAIINSGMAFGIATGMLTASAALAMGGTGWRTPLLALSLLTFGLWAVMVRVVRRDQPVTLVSGPSAAEPAGPGAGAGGLRIGRNVALAYFVAFATMYGFFVVLTWLPYYLETQRGISGVGSGVVSAAVAFTAVPAGVLAGRVSDSLGLRRPLLLALTPLAGLALALIVLAPSLAWVYVAIVVYGLTGKLVVDPLIVALVADGTPARGYGTAFGLLNFSGTISTVLAPAVTGYIADLTGSFDSAFLLAAGLQLAAVLCVLLMKPEAGKAGQNDNVS